MASAIICQKCDKTFLIVELPLSNKGILCAIKLILEYYLLIHLLGFYYLGDLEYVSVPAGFPERFLNYMDCTEPCHK